MVVKKMAILKIVMMLMNRRISEGGSFKVLIIEMHNMLATANTKEIGPKIFIISIYCVFIRKIDLNRVGTTGVIRSIVGRSSETTLPFR
jgi:hypothetical protein